MPNIAVVVLDTLRKDAFDEYFDWLPGIRFENAWSPCHWTAPVHAAMFVGKYPSELGVSSQHGATLDCEEPTIAEALSGQGYTTRAFSCNPYVSETFQFGRGFDQFDGNWRLQMLDPDVFEWNTFINKTRSMGPLRYPYAFWRCLQDECDTLTSLRFGTTLKLRDLGIANLIDDGARTALDWVRSTTFGDDEFLFMNLMEAHTPYNPPDEYQRVSPPGVDLLEKTLSGNGTEDETVCQAYKDSVSYLSDRYREIFDVLDESFDYIITVSDHGEMLGEGGVWGHSYGIYPSLTHVPVCVSGRRDTIKRKTTPVSLLDVHQTILELANVPCNSRGRNLLGELEPAMWLTEYHGLQPHIESRVREIAPNELDVYNRQKYGIAVASEYYGYETMDGFEECGRTDANPREKIDRIRDEIDVVDATRTRALSDDVLEHLSDLGYA